MNARRIVVTLAGMTALLGLSLDRPVLAHDFTEGFCCTSVFGECIEFGTIFFEHCVPAGREEHSDPRCRDGHRQDHCECPVSTCGTVSGCVPDVPDGAAAETPNGLDDDCDGFIDDEQCDDDDNDGDGMIDEDLGSCLLKMLFVPMDWRGTQQEFEDAVEEQLGVFKDQFDFDDPNLGCPDNIGVTIQSLASNIAATTCSTFCGVDEVIDEVAAIIDPIVLRGFDVVVALTDHGICGATAGCADGSPAPTVWLETDEPGVLAHELGHILGLTDEYNSMLNGPPNALGDDLGCDPAPGSLGASCCIICSDTGGEICCAGNENRLAPHCGAPIVCEPSDCTHCPEGFDLSCAGRCLMSYADACGGRGYCERCFDHLTSPPDARDAGNPDGQAPMDCTFVHGGAQRSASGTVTLTEAGAMSILHFSVGEGRLGLGKRSVSGRYGIEIRDLDDTLLNHTLFDLGFGYRDPKFRDVDYSSIQYDKVVQGFRLRVPPEVDDADPLRIVALKDGEVTWRSTLNGSPPVADAGGDRTVECNQPGGAAVTLDGGGSGDPDGDFVGYRWSAAGIVFDDPTSAAPTGSFPLGSTVVTLVVNDGIDDSPPDMMEVTVVDTTAPVIDVVGLEPAELWPPNHRLVEVTATVTAADVCDPNPISVVLTSVTSDEPDNAPGGGDGNTTNDIQGAQLGLPDFSFELRAERAGSGDGRIYTAVYTATDDSGNAAAGAGFAVVPHDQGGGTDPIDARVELSPAGAVVWWSAAPGAQSYDVIRGALGNVHDAGPVIDLGPVICIENDSLDENTAGREDAVVPAPGDVFFYLVQYFDGASSSYGTESAGKPQAPGPGDCE